MSTSAPNKHQRTSINGWNAASRPSPGYRSRLDAHSPSPSPATTSSGKRVVANARRDQYDNMMDAVNAVTAENSAVVAAMRSQHAQALSIHSQNSASSSSIASNSMIIDDPRPELDAEGKAEAAALYQRLRQREAHALRRLADQRQLAVADSQRYAKQEQVRAKAAAITDPYNNPDIPASRKHVGKAYREPEYQDEITRYMVEMDNDAMANAESMDSQPEVQWYMRPFLVDFLIEVHAQFRLRPEVLYLAMNIVDRYVSKRVVYKKHYQLVGCAALWTAAKFEDAKDKVPLTKELSEMCCKAYDESAFIQMEGHVLGTIGWDLGAPTAEAWLRMYTVEELEDKRTANVARFIMEVSLFHRDFVGVPAYDIAAGAVILARYICGKPKRRDLGVSRPAIYGGADSADRAIRIAYQLDNKLHNEAEPVSDVLRRKYTPSYYHSASVMVREWYSKPGHRYTNFVEPILSGRHFNFASPTPSIGTSWRQGSWMSSSPTASHSCSSSENGDEGPITPITPNHPHQANADPFSQASKENVNPTPTRVKSGPIPNSIRPIAAKAAVVVADTNMLYPQRPALLAIPSAGDLSASHRNQQVPRRLSN